MKKSVNLKTINIINRLIEIDNKNENNKTDEINKCIDNISKNYFLNYVEPLLIELNDKKIIEYDKTKIKTNSDTRRNYLKAYSYIREVVNSKENIHSGKFENYDRLVIKEFELFDLDKYRLKCDDNDVFFLQSNETTIKKEFANKIKDIFLYEYLTNKYYKEYIEKDLYKQNKIIYYKNPKTEYEKKYNTLVQACVISIINYMYVENIKIYDNLTIVQIINCNNKTIKEKVSYNICCNILPINYNNIEITKLYNQHMKTNNKNNYSQYNFSNYFEVIKDIYNL